MLAAYPHKSFQISIAGIPFAVELKGRGNGRLYRKLKSKLKGFVCADKKPRHRIKIFYNEKGLAANFTPLEKVHPVTSELVTGQADKVGGNYLGEDGGFQPEADPPLAEKPASAQTARPVRNAISNRVKERSSLTGFTPQAKNLEVFASRQVLENNMLWDVFWDKLILYLCDCVLSHPDIVLLHAAACAKDNKGYLFLGPSKSGKTTVASLVRDYLVLADDKILVRRVAKEYFLFPLPLLSYESKKLQGDAKRPPRIEKIFLLKKSKRVRFKKVSKARAMAELFERIKDLNRLSKLNIKKVAQITYQMAQALGAFTMYFKKDSSFWHYIEKGSE